MKSNKAIRAGNYLFAGISILGLASVSLLSLHDPQATMDLVKVKLPNTDALSSIRGIYGGVGMTIVIGLTYLLSSNLTLAVRFLTLFWSSYALSRLTTIFANGPLGDFGNQWMLVESVFSLIGLLLIIGERK